MSSLSARWAGGRRFLHTSPSGHALVTDTSRQVGGEDSAPSPMELVLHGLAGCTGVDVIAILEKMKQPVRGLEVTVEAERAEEHPRVYTSVNIHYTLRGALDRKKVARAVSLSESTYCSVSAMLKGTVILTSSWEIQPAGDQPGSPEY